MRPSVLPGIALLGMWLPSAAAPPPADGRLETRHFVFEFQPSERGVAEHLAQSADRHRARVLGDLGTTGPDATRVRLAADPAAMRRVAPAGVRVPVWAAGMAFPRLNLILLRTRSGTGRVADIEQVFVHEWAHVALDHAVTFRHLPRWFREGFAIFQSGEWSFGRVRSLASGVLSGRLFSLQALDEQFPDRPGDVELAYAQSIDFVSFLLGEYGRDRFHRLVDLLRDGWPFFLAVEEAYQDGLFAIEDAWHRDLKMRFTWIPLITGTATLWFLATLVLIAAYLRKRRSRRREIEALDDLDFPDSLNPPNHV